MFYCTVLVGKYDLYDSLRRMGEKYAKITDGQPR